MKKETILIASIALLVGVIGGYCVSVAKYELNDSRAYERYDEVRMYGDEDEWEGGMMGMMGSFPYGYDDDDAHRGHMMEMVVGSEKEFLTEMIPHHQEAVDTAKEVLARGATTPEIRVLVENIITAQEQEIAEMKEWYQGWYGEAYRDDGSYRPMMRELKGLSGGVLDRASNSDIDYLWV